MNEYELMFILRTSLVKEELEKTTQGILEEIKKNNGEIQNTQDLGKRKLAYPVKKQREGFYQTVNFKLNPALIKSLKSFCKLNENVLRILILRKV